jgi:very-short-patch-repair endonuclease
MPPRRSDAKTMRWARELRLNQTPEEARLWSRLRAHRLAGVGFRRQHAIGNYIVDFCAPRKKLIIEVDGSQHIDFETYDEDRTAFLYAKGYRVVRFSNDDVRRNIESVLAEIESTLEAS